MMSVSRAHDAATSVCVVSRRRDGIRVRIRGLLRNPALAERLRIQGLEPGAISLDTGTVRLAIDATRGEQFWLERLAAAVMEHPDRPTARARPAPMAAPAAPVPDTQTARSVPRRKKTESEHAAAPDQGLGKLPARVAREPAANESLDHSSPESRLADLLDLGESLSGFAGLDDRAVLERQQRYGRNAIDDVTGRAPVEILVDQFRSLPVALLAGSAGLSLATRAFGDAAAIAAVLGANASLGYLTESRAEQTITSLRKIGPRKATVVRNGAQQVIDASDVTVGDLLILEPGMAVAADARVIEAHRLATNEAALTGESLPVRKEPVEQLPLATSLGERRNMVFMGTVVTGGAGRAIVLSTGESTALGRIRQLAQGAQAPRTRLQIEIDSLGKRLAIGASVLCVGIFAIGLMRGRPLLPLLRSTVSLGVAAIPEGLPTVATSLLASTIRSLRTKNVYARRLEAIENLGAIDTVCFDKTGTLTQNRMSLEVISWGNRLRLLEDGIELPGLPPQWLLVAVLCNSVERVATTAQGGAQASWHGSSTEIALLEFAIRQGAAADVLRMTHRTLDTRHRSEHHPYMVTVHAQPGEGVFIAVKGRPDEVLARCESWFNGSRFVALTRRDRKALLELNDELAARGNRVLALAFRHQESTEYGQTAGLCWLGLAGLEDPLRPDLPQMVMRFHAAGIRPMMITGDQPGTAQAVLTRIGMANGRPVVDAANLPESAAELSAIAEQASGFARTSPAMKLEIVRSLQNSGHVVAMTGDGINDGPALKVADVGVAMGVTGTDFAHAMSDLVLRDDHPQAILAAIEEGRTAFANIEKAVRYLVATNLSELATTTVSAVLGIPEPFDPMALLWTNIATDIWPAIALGLEPADPDVLNQPPMSLRAGLLDSNGWRAVLTDSALLSVSTLSSFGYGLARYGPGPQAKTLAFMTMTVSQLLYALSARSHRPLRKGGLPPNRMLNAAVGVSLLAQVGTVALPLARRALRTTPLGIADALAIVTTAVIPLIGRELLKERG